ncbi:DUF2096 domain-containing protein [Methanobacterium sp. ACI-7]|uniref:DUF2096 domain-containing protein n=1 Tax=unclassified Methanobacterium TaxID=2627676 RepID=UPI0039C2347D
MNDLPVEQTWLILVDLLTDLKKKDKEIPDEITKNVRLARSTINFYSADPTNPEMMKELKRINDFLNSIQDTLLDIADEVDKEYKKEWLDKLIRASRGEKVVEKEDTSPRFVVGAPAGFSMVRVNFKEPLSEERLNDIAEGHGVIIEFESDDVIAVYGEKDSVKESLKEIASFFKE